MYKLTITHKDEEAVFPQVSLEYPVAQLKDCLAVTFTDEITRVKLLRYVLEDGITTFRFDNVDSQFIFPHCRFVKTLIEKDDCICFLINYGTTN